MAAPDGNKAYPFGGRLAHSCTSLAGGVSAWPHGGTGLGLVGQVFLFPQRRVLPLIQEETNSPSEVWWLGDDLTVSLTAEGWDEDAVAFLRPNTAAGGSGRRVMSWPGSTVPAGTPTTTYTNVVFTPFDPSAKGFVLYKAAPIPDLNQQLAFSSRRLMEQAAVLIALPDGSDRLGMAGQFADLSL